MSIAHPSLLPFHLPRRLLIGPEIFDRSFLIHTRYVGLSEQKKLLPLKQIPPHTPLHNHNHNLKTSTN